MIGVVLASELTVLREGMKRILRAEPDIDVVAEVKHVTEVSGDATPQQAKLIVIIAPPPVGDSHAHLLQLQRVNPALRAIVIARSPSLPQILLILRHGARGLLSASCAGSHLPAAIRAVAAGRLYLHEDVARFVAAHVGDLRKDHTHTSLTQREHEVFIKLAAGHRVSDIAVDLGISVKTVSTHKSRLMEKMGITSHSQIIQYAVANSLIGASTRH